MDIERSLAVELRDDLRERAAALRHNAEITPEPLPRAAAWRGKAKGIDYAADLLTSLIAGNTAWRDH